MSLPEWLTVTALYLYCLRWKGECDRVEEPRSWCGNCRARFRAEERFALEEKS